MNFPSFRPLWLAGAIAIGAVMSGCVATPVDPYYGGTGYGYGADYGYSNYGYSGYGYPAGAGFGYYGAAPVVVAPVGIGFSGVFGSGGHRGHWNDRGYGHGHQGGYRPNYGGGWRPGYGAVKPQPGPAVGGWGVRQGGGGAGRVGGGWGRR